MKPATPSPLTEAGPDRNFSTGPRAKLRFALGIMGVAVLFTALRWNSFDAPLVRDEGEYAYAAQLLAHGMAPYEHSFLQKPPMAIYDYALAWLVAPNTFWFPRVLSCLSAALATLLLGFIARLELGRDSVLPVMWLMTPMLLLPQLNQFIANTETFMLAPLMGTIALCVYYRERTSLLAWFAGGALAAFTFWYKYSALPLLAVIFAAWSISERRHAAPTPSTRLWKDWLSALFGAAVASAAALGFFLLKDGGAHLWECTVRFNRFYVGSADFGPRQLLERLHWFWTDWWLLFLLPIVLIVQPMPRLRFWFVLFAAAWLTTGMSHYAHYYVLVVPFWAFLCAAAIDRLATWSAARLSWSRAWVSRCATGAVVMMLCLSDFPWVTWPRQRFAVEKLPWLPFAESVVVARRVDEITSPQDYVYVAGSEPQILAYARRFSPTRFNIAYPLMIPTPLAGAYQQEAEESLRLQPPAVIVLARSGSSWMRQKDTPPDFQAFLDYFLAEQYEVIGGFVVTLDSRGWREPLAASDFANATLVLYKRKRPTPTHSLAVRPLVPAAALATELSTSLAVPTSATPFCALPPPLAMLAFSP